MKDKRHIGKQWPAGVEEEKGALDGQTKFWSSGWDGERSKRGEEKENSDRAPLWVCVSTLKFEIPPRFVDSMAVSYDLSLFLSLSFIQTNPRNSQWKAISVHSCSLETTTFLNMNQFPVGFWQPINTCHHIMNRDYIAVISIRDAN